MVTAARRAEIEEVDRFLAESKTLSEGLPPWSDSHIPGRLSAAWPVADQDGVVREGTRLALICKASDTSYLSVTLLLRGNRIYSVDLVPAGQRKTNGPMARYLGLPPVVVGPHFHRWEDNREHALANGAGDMPHRRETPPLLVRLPHALTALCQATNIILTPEQASFDVPPQGTLPWMLGG